MYLGFIVGFMRFFFEVFKWFIYYKVLVRNEVVIVGLESGILVYCFGVINFKLFYFELREGKNERKLLVK